MHFSRIDQEEIRALVREEIALDEARRLEGAPTPARIKPAPSECAGAGEIPTSPAPTNLVTTAEFVAQVLRDQRDRRHDIEAVTLRKGGRTSEIRLIASGRSFILKVSELEVMA